MPIGRRVFVRDGVLGLAAAAALPGFLARSARAAEPGRRQLVVLFLRGAVDMLNVVVPCADPDYPALRPSLAIPRGALLPLDGAFGLHPALAPLAPRWAEGHLAPVVAAGSPDPTRSHFEAQAYMESGTPGIPATPDGWLNRCAGALPGPPSPWRAVAPGPNLPRALSGAAPALALGGIAAAPAQGPDSAAVEAMYAASSDAAARRDARAALDAARVLRALRPDPAARAGYPRGGFGAALQQLAAVLKADLGVATAFADLGGFDHHVSEGGVEGRLAERLGVLAAGLAAFWADLGDRAEDVVVVALTEFGRTARENGDRGTDHGHGSAMLLLGGPVRGGKVYGRWPGLAPTQLHDGRDLAVTTDFRLVLGEVVTRHLGVRELGAVFPGFNVAGAGGFLGVLGPRS